MHALALQRWGIKVTAWFGIDNVASSNNILWQLS
jgi:hypothetical protein